MKTAMVKNMKGLESLEVSDSIEKICKQYLSPSSDILKADKVTFREGNEISSIINNALMQKMNSKLSDIVHSSFPELDKSRLINNMYLMLSILVTSLKIAGIEDKLLPLLLGNIGGKIDLLYKLAITIGDLVITNVDTKTLSFKVKDHNKKMYHIDKQTSSLYSSHIGGYAYDSMDILHMLDDDTLKMIHNKLYANVKIIIEFLSM